MGQTEWFNHLLRIIISFLKLYDCVHIIFIRNTWYCQTVCKKQTNKQKKLLKISYIKNVNMNVQWMWFFNI